MAIYGLTIFIGAFLLFQVQPLIGKYILPWFGGGPGVWTTCMLFFQALLLGGYAYAHFSSRWLKPRMQATLHLLLLLASLALLPIIPSAHWKPHGGEDPTVRILGLLAVTIGLPYFALSATGPLMQHWFSRTSPGVSPYRLFALSNAGSLLALISYPLFFEIQFTRQAQATFWAGGLVVFLFAAAACAWKLFKTTDPDAREKPTTTTSNLPAPNEPAAPRASKATSPKKARPGSGKSKTEPVDSAPSPIDWLFWLLLPGCASVLLLATTNKLCQDVAVIPFLWVLPLALYLISFIVCFDNPRWYLRVPFSVSLLIAIGATCRLMFEGTNAPLSSQILTYSAMLFLGCMVCHGELYRLKPEPGRLTGYYLAIAAGGALGGFFVAIVAPLIFTNYHEWHWGMILCVALMLLVWIREGERVSREDGRSEVPAETGFAFFHSWTWMAGVLGLLVFIGLDRLIAVVGRQVGLEFKAALTGLRIVNWLILAGWSAWWIARKRAFRYGRGLACGFLALLWLVLCGTLWEEARDANKESIYTSRNFYGVLSVFEYQKDMPHGRYLLLQHGEITHGLQFTHPDQAGWATTYYGPGSGIAKAIHALPQTSRRIGVVGLGTGTMAAFARAGDYVRIYEINPEVIHLANSHFTYLSNCPAKVEIALGDARLSMENEAPQQFDLLALDAFSSDAIPVHLLTREAFQLYQRHLKTNGVIAVHVSNHYLNLEPVVVNLARHFQYELAIIDYEENEDGDDWWYYSSTWLLLTHDQQLLRRPEIHGAASEVETNRIPLWTDDFASLFQIFQK